MEANIVKRICNIFSPINIKHVSEIFTYIMPLFYFVDQRVSLMLFVLAFFVITVCYFQCQNN